MLASASIMTIVSFLVPGGQLKTTRHTYHELLNNLKFDESDPILDSNNATSDFPLILSARKTQAKIHVRETDNMY